MAGTDHRPHTQHKEGDKCPVCQLAWELWPNAHKADLVCSQRCEKSEQGQRLIAYELNQVDIAAGPVCSRCGEARDDPGYGIHVCKTPRADLI